MPRRKMVKTLLKDLNKLKFRKSQMNKYRSLSNYYLKEYNKLTSSALYPNMPMSKMFGQAIAGLVILQKFPEYEIWKTLWETDKFKITEDMFPAIKYYFLKAFLPYNSVYFYDVYLGMDRYNLLIEKVYNILLSRGTYVNEEILNMFNAYYDTFQFVRSEEENLASLSHVYKELFNGKITLKNLQNPTEIKKKIQSFDYREYYIKETKLIDFDKETYKVMKKIEQILNEIKANNKNNKEEENEFEK